MISRLLIILAALLPVAAQAQPAPVTVFAAASLRGALDQVAAGYGAPVALSFGGSGTCHMPNHTTTTSSSSNTLLSLLATAAAPVLPVCKCAPFYGGVKCDHCLDHRTGYECTKCLPGRQGSTCEACPGLNR